METKNEKGRVLSASERLREDLEYAIGRFVEKLKREIGVR